jgi:hypothetical protein
MVQDHTNAWTFKQGTDYKSILVVWEETIRSGCSGFQIAKRIDKALILTALENND